MNDLVFLHLPLLLAGGQNQGAFFKNYQNSFYNREAGEAMIWEGQFQMNTLWIFQDLLEPMSFLFRFSKGLNFYLFIFKTKERTLFFCTLVKIGTEAGLVLSVKSPNKILPEAVAHVDHMISCLGISVVLSKATNESPYTFQNFCSVLTDGSLTAMLCWLAVASKSRANSAG